MSYVTETLSNASIPDGVCKLRLQELYHDRSSVCILVSCYP